MNRADIDTKINQYKKEIRECQQQIKILEEKKSLLQKCEYNKAWIGTCGKYGQTNIDGHFYCEEHRSIYCSCGEKAISECSHAGQFVCGRPLCKKCSCKH